MTNKQIIINGVDVSKCNYFNNTDKSCCEERCSEFGCAICNDRPNCYYKQLAYKEQECEKLKEKLLHKRAVIEFADCPYYSYGDNTIEPTCNKKFCYDVKSCDYKNMVKYKQTLAEIKEIAENMNKECFYDDFECKDCDMKNGCTYFNKRQILQKISENEVNNAR